MRLNNLSREDLVAYLEGKDLWVKCSKYGAITVWIKIVRIYKTEYGQEYVKYERYAEGNSEKCIASCNNSAYALFEWFSPVSPVELITDSDIKILAKLTYTPYTIHGNIEPMVEEDEWEYHLSGNHEAESVLIYCDNNNTVEHKSWWWDDAKEVVDKLSTRYYYEGLDSFIDSYKISSGVYKQNTQYLTDAYYAYGNSEYDLDNPRFVMEIAEALYKNRLHLVCGEMNARGLFYTIIYPEGAIEDLDIFQDWYFGNIVELTLSQRDDDDDYMMEYGSDIEYNTITHTEYKKMSLEDIAKLFNKTADSVIFDL